MGEGMGMDFEDFRNALREAIKTTSIAQVKETLGKYGYKKASDVKESEYQTIVFELEGLGMDKKVDGFSTIDDKEDKGFWVVHTLGDHFSTPLKYHSLRAAKEQAQTRLKSCPGRVVYVFKASCVLTARIEADEVRLA